MQQIIINNNIAINSPRDRNNDESYINRIKNPSGKGLPNLKQPVQKSAFSNNPKNPSGRGVIQ